VELIAVLAGSALGGMARFALSNAVTRQLGERFPWGTLAVNLSGALLIGILAGAVLGQADAATGDLGWHLAVVGFLGSYTTVSSFSLQTLAFMHDRKWRAAGLNIALSLGLCIGLAALGFVLSGQLAGRLA
jgi:fluoride exporter